MNQSVGACATAAQNSNAIYRKITWRLMPYLFLCYILAYVDRVNVGFAKLQMQQDLGMSDAVYGIGAGIFFIGYFFFEVPSNIIMHKLGARFWIGPIMILWGVVSTCTMFVTNATGFYTVRFLLGIVESGFFPGVILYLTYWFTSKHRARMVAAFMSAIPLSGVVAGPICGWILGQTPSAGHLKAWQWLFLMEGVPSVFVGAITMYFLTDNPMKAKWLSPDEKEHVLSQLQQEELEKVRAGQSKHKIGDVFRSGRVWLLCLVFFGFVMGNYGLGFWLPQVISDTITKDPVSIGWISVIPWLCGAVAMILVGKHSDASGERRWHIAGSAILGAAAFATSAIPGISGVAGIVALTFATIGIMCAFSIFWALPSRILSGTAAAAGIAWINSVGNLAGYVSPYVVGTIRVATHSMTLALLVLAAAAFMSATATLYVTRSKAG
jgi:D-galactonate transporter